MLAHVPLGVHQEPQALSCRAALQPSATSIHWCPGSFLPRCRTLHFSRNSMRLSIMKLLREGSCFSRGVGLGDLQRFFPAPTVLRFHDPVSATSQPGECTLDGCMALWSLSHCPQFCASWQSPEGSLCPAIQILSEDIRTGPTTDLSGTPIIPGLQQDLHH